jgi:hypothetical protein
VIRYTETAATIQRKVTLIAVFFSAKCKSSLYSAMKSEDSNAYRNPIKIAKPCCKFSSWEISL